MLCNRSFIYIIYFHKDAEGLREGGRWSGKEVGDDKMNIEEEDAVQIMCKYFLIRFSGISSLFGLLERNVRIALWDAFSIFSVY